ncbi:MAG: FGGY family carbohydrate kinase [Actinomycetota bacterium]|nr:FGGY family carbohydrate kinase [Actinomycetota bacterium]
MAIIVAIDLGTSSIRTTAYSLSGDVLASNGREIQLQVVGERVEQDAYSIGIATLELLRDLEIQLGDDSKEVAAIGITNQRESTLGWRRSTGEVLTPLISWQDGRGQESLARIEAEYGSQMIIEKTGLAMSPYFSATKMESIVQSDALIGHSDAALGTLDSYITYLLGGANLKSPFITDPSNASRTMVFNIDTLDFDDELLSLFQIPKGLLPEISPTTVSDIRVASGLPFAGVPIASIAGDQQASLFGQGRFDVGDTKVTHGTGTFILSNAGSIRRRPKGGLLESIGWQLRRDLTPNSLVYVTEGTIFTSGSAIRFLRDNLSLISDYSEIDQVAESVKDSDTVTFIPSFSGLGTPYWRRDVGGAIYGLSASTTKGHIVRAALEGVAIRTTQVIEQMENVLGEAISVVTCDGGLTRSKVYLKIQADQSNREVILPKIAESSSYGAFLLAAISVGELDLPRAKEVVQFAEVITPSKKSYSSSQRRQRFENYMDRHLSKA